MQDINSWAAQLRSGTPISAISNQIAGAGGGDRVLALALSQADRPRDALAAFSRALADPNEASEIGDLSAGAMLALQAGQSEEAAVLIDRALGDPRVTRMDLRSIAQNAWILGDRERTLRAAELLHDRFPGDLIGLTLLAEQWCRRHRFAEAHALLAPHVERLSENGQYTFALASHRMAPCVGIQAFLTAVPALMRPKAIADEIYCSLTDKAWDRIDAAILAIDPECKESGEIVRALCRALEVWLLEIGLSEKHASLEYPGRWIHAGVALVAARPEDSTNRLRLEELTGPGGLGEITSFALLNPLLADPADTGPCPAYPNFEPGDTSLMAEFREFTRSLYADRQRILLVPKPLDRSVDAACAERLIRGGVMILDIGLVKPTLDETDVRTFVLLLSALLDIVHTAYDTRLPHGAALAIAMVHRVVARLAMQGLQQAARDLVETALLIAGGTLEAAIRADAWLALADVRLRGHQLLPALLALAHASRVLPSDPKRRMNYRSLAVRLLREVRCLDAAVEHLRAYEALADTHPGLVDPAQHSSLHWSLTLASAADRLVSGTWTDADSERVGMVVRQTYDVCSDDEAAPHRMVAASNLVHAIQLLRDQGCSVPIDEVTLRSRLAALGASLPGTFQALIAEAPTLGHLRAAVDECMSSRHGDDLLSDTQRARVIARRLLSTDADLESRAAAIEVLSDLEASFQCAEEPQDPRITRAATSRLFERAREGRAIDGIVDLLPRTTPSGGEHPLRAVLADPQKFLRRLLDCSRASILLEATCLLGDGLAHFRVVHGEARWTVEPRTNFDPHRLMAYTRIYPYAYHAMDANSFNPEFEVADTLRGLCLSTTAADVRLRCVVPDHRLLAIPGNLQMVGEAFAGDLYPNCQVPSLGWLLDAYETRSQVRLPWQASVWVLREDPDAMFSPLTIGAEGLTELLAPLGVVMHRDAELGSVRPSPITWILGHGALGLDAKHFARVSSDRHDRHFADELVARIEDASLVVLLMCSGGRESHELFAERVHGMPAALLRRGVRTVIASPWPLDVLVGTRWSGAFAERLIAGDTVADAAFAANASLAGRHPKDRLAMHVYGDPWLRIQAAEETT